MDSGQFRFPGVSLNRQAPISLPVPHIPANTTPSVRAAYDAQPSAAFHYGSPWDQRELSRFFYNSKLTARPFNRAFKDAFDVGRA